MASLQQILEATGFGRIRPDQDPRLVQQPVPQTFGPPPPPAPGPLINRNAGVTSSEVTRRVLPPSAPGPSGLELLNRVAKSLGTPMMQTPDGTDQPTPNRAIPITPSRTVDRNKGVTNSDATRKTVPSSSGKDNYDAAERARDIWGGIIGRASNTPIDISPPIMTPANSAWWFARNLFGMPMGGPPAKPGTPPSIGEQTFTPPANEGSAPPSIGKTLAATPSAPSGGEGGRSAANPRGASFGSPAGPQAQPPGSASSSDIGKFLLQMGLNLMVPQWGNSLSRIGQAAGAGAEAVGRSRKEEQETELTNKKFELEQARIDKMGTGRKGAGESSRSKRAKEKKPLEAFGENLSPEATLYFQQRLKNLKGESEVTNDDGTTATLSEADQYNNILRETKIIDARSRASRGMARSDEIPEDKLRAYVGTPNEMAVLNTVASDPVQRAILMQRIENIKRAKAAANANTPAAATAKPGN